MIRGRNRMCARQLAALWGVCAIALALVVSTSPLEELGVRAMAAAALLVAGAFTLWSVRTASTVSLVVLGLAAAHVVARGDGASAVLVLLAGAGLIGLGAARAATCGQLQEQQQLALADELTGLANRRAMTAHLSASLSRHGGGAPADALLLLDVDNFKQVNDRLGHEAGDAVLVDVAAAARDAVGDRGVVARWGGEEFLLLLGGTCAAQATAVGDDVRAAIGRAAGVTCSIGVAPAIPGQTVHGWVAAADRAMYRAKAAGRDRVVVAVGDSALSAA